MSRMKLQLLMLDFDKLQLNLFMMIFVLDNRIYNFLFFIPVRVFHVSLKAHIQRKVVTSFNEFKSKFSITSDGKSTGHSTLRWLDHRASRNIHLSITHNQNPVT